MNIVICIHIQEHKMLFPLWASSQVNFCLWADFNLSCNEFTSNRKQGADITVAFRIFPMVSMRDLVLFFTDKTTQKSSFLFLWCIFCCQTIMRCAVAHNVFETAISKLSLMCISLHLTSLSWKSVHSRLFKPILSVTGPCLLQITMPNYKHVIDGIP